MQGMRRSAAIADLLSPQQAPFGFWWQAALRSFLFFHCFVLRNGGLFRVRASIVFLSMIQSVCVNVSVNRLFRALQELEAAGMLPSSQEEAARLANRIRIRGADDAITIVLPEVR